MTAELIFPRLIGPGSFIGLCVLMLIFLEIGRRIRLASPTKKATGASSSSNVGPVETIIFALLGLLLAFTFTGAENRFEARRQLITVEANAIGTAYLRVNLLPKEAQLQMRELFKKYVLIRGTTYQHLENLTDTQTFYNTASKLQKQMWVIATANCTQKDAATYCAMLLLPALNDMFDITTTRFVALYNHPPYIIYLLLISLSLFSALLVGYDLPPEKKRHMLYMLSYAIIISLAIYLIMDLEMPRYGYIRIDEADKIILSLKNSM